MYRTTKKKMVRRASVSAAVALGALATGAGIANAASSHHVAVSAHQSAQPATGNVPPSAGAPTDPADNQGQPGDGQCLGGKVTAVSATSLTVTDPSGTATTYALTSSTTFTKDGASATAADVTVGSFVRITVASTSATTATAVDIDTDAPGTNPGPQGAWGHMAGGTVTAVNASSITVKDLSGTSTTYTLTSSTTVTKERQSATLADVTVGESVRLTLSSSSSTTVSAIDIELAHVIGQVTAVSGNTITVQGPRSGTQTITVSSATTYSKSGASATLADVTVGSFVFAEGVSSSAGSLNASTVGIGLPAGNFGPGHGPSDGNFGPGRGGDFH